MKVREKIYPEGENVCCAAELSHDLLILVAKYVKSSQTILYFIFIPSKQECINTPVILIGGCVPLRDWLVADDSFQQAGVGLARRGWVSG